MKFSSAFFSILLMASCSSDNNTINSNGTIVVEGLYSVTAANTTPTTDLNSDGTDSTNQMEETTCYDDMQISFNGFGDFTAIFKKVVIGSAIDVGTGDEILSEDCETTLAEGTYVLTGDQLTLTYTLNGSQITEVYTASPNTIRRTLTNQQLVDSTPDDSYEYVNGDLLFVFANN